PDRRYFPSVRLALESGSDRVGTPEAATGRDARGAEVGFKPSPLAGEGWVGGSVAPLETSAGSRSRARINPRPSKDDSSSPSSFIRSLAFRLNRVERGGGGGSAAGFGARSAPPSPLVIRPPRPVPATQAGSPPPSATSLRTEGAS